ncbi:MAG: hypothetical protein Q9208_008492 [Pyrenodesmia sp. 3 TL-2023]
MAVSPRSMQVPTQTAPQSAQLLWPQDPTAPLGSFQNPVPYESCIPGRSAASPPSAVSSPASVATRGPTAQPQDSRPATAEIDTPFSPPPPSASADNGTMQRLVPNAAPALSADRGVPLPLDINAFSGSLQSTTSEEARSSHRQIPTRSNSGRRVHFHDEETRTRASRDAEARAAARARENEAEVHEFTDVELANRQRSMRWRPRTPVPSTPSSSVTRSSTGPLQPDSRNSSSDSFVDPSRDWEYERWPLCTVSTLTFYVQTWDEYYTKTLTLGLVSGPVEGILTLCIVYAITGVKGGGSYWQQSMLQAFGLPKYSFIPEYVYNLPFTEWYMAYGGIVLVSNTLQSALNVMQIRRKDSKDPITPLYGLLPYFTTWALVPLYLYLQPIILHHHLIPFVFYIGLINAYSVGQIIIAHLTKDPQFPMYNVLIIPLALAVVDSLGPAVGVWPSALGSGTYQIAFVSLCMGLGFGVYGSFVVSAILHLQKLQEAKQYWDESEVDEYADERIAVRHHYDDMRLP